VIAAPIYYAYLRTNCRPGGWSDRSARFCPNRISAIVHRRPWGGGNGRPGFLACAGETRGLLILVGAVVRLPAHLTSAISTDGPHPMPGFIVMTLARVQSRSRSPRHVLGAGSIVDRAVLRSDRASGLPATLRHWRTSRSPALVSISSSAASQMRLLLGPRRALSRRDDTRYAYSADRSDGFRRPAQRRGSIALGFAISLGARRIVALRRTC